MTFEEVAALLWQVRRGRRLATRRWTAPVRPAPSSTRPTGCAGRSSCAGPAIPCGPTLRPECGHRAARRMIATLADVVGHRARTGERSHRDRSPTGWPGVWSASESSLVGDRHRMRPSSSWPTTSWRPRPWPFGWRRPPGPTSTTRCWPAWPPWPDRCTAGPASGPTSCWWRPSATAPPGRSTTPCAGSATCPGSGTWSTPEGDPRFDALLALVEPLLSEERRRSAAPRSWTWPAPTMCRPRNCDLALAALSWGTGMPHRRRPHHLHRGPRRRLDRPLPGGARRTPAALPRPCRLQRVTGSAPLSPGETPQPRAQAAPLGRSACPHPRTSPSGQKSPVTASWT